jgi:hypothetical protein
MRRKELRSRAARAAALLPIYGTRSENLSALRSALSRSIACDAQSRGCAGYSSGSA